MKRIFSVLFAVVLVASFSLVPAVPAAANGVPNPTFATLDMTDPANPTTPSAKISIGWERNPVIPGAGFSAPDAIHVTTTTPTLDYAMVIVPTNFTLATGNEISYWGYTQSPSDVKALDEIYLFLDGGEILLSHQPGPEASVWYNSWHEWTLGDVNNQWHTWPYVDAVLANYIGRTVLAIALTVGPTTPGVPVNIDVYFDKLTVDGDVLLDNDTGFIDVPLPLTGFPAPAIQDAIDAALTGDTINVAAGTYDPFTVDTKTNLTIQSGGAVTVQGSQSVTTAYTDRDCVVFVKDSTSIVLEGLDIQGQGLGTINTKNYGVIYENSSGKINGCTISPNTIGNMNSMAIGIWDSSDVDVESCTAENYGRIGVFIYNGCTVDIIGGSIEGQAYSGEDEVCYGVEVEGAWMSAEPATASHVLIDGVEIYNCDNTFSPEPSWGSSGVLINGWLEYFDAANSTVEIANCNIHNNYAGIYAIKSPSSYAHFNDIYDNRDCGVESAKAHDGSTAVFDAKYNWWGDISGPQHETTWQLTGQPITNPGGTGNKVSDKVNYVPWLTRDFLTVLDANIGYFGVPWVDLDTGWNTFSTPIALDPGETIDGVTYPGCNTWGDYKALGDGLNVMEGVVNAYRYDAGASPPRFVALVSTDPLTPCDAIYVRMAEPDIAAILFSPEPSAPTKEVYQGWNLIGLAWIPNPGIPPMMMFVEEALITLYTVPGDYTGYSVVVSPPFHQQSWTFVRDSVSGPPPLTPPRFMVLTKGYWVFMENGPDTLAGFSFTPILLSR